MPVICNKAAEFGCTEDECEHAVAHEYNKLYCSSMLCDEHNCGACCVKSETKTAREED